MRCLCHPRPRPCRQALGALGRARAAARPQALHRPASRLAQRQPQCPRPAPARARVGGGRTAPEASPAGGFRSLRVEQAGPRARPGIISLGRWGARSPSKPRDAELGVDSLILSFRPMFDARAVERFTASFAQRVRALAASFTVRIEHPGVFAAGDVRIARLNVWPPPWARARSRTGGL